MDTNFYPKVGMRFLFSGSEYEIAYCSFGSIRYSAIAGGKSYKIPTDTFSELVSSKKITLDCVTGCADLTVDNAPSFMRKRRYVEAAISFSASPTSLKTLAVVISSISESLGDKKPPCPRTVGRWVQSYTLKSDAGLHEKKRTGNNQLRFDIDVERLIAEGIAEVYLVPERRTAEDVRAHIAGKLLELGLITSKTSDVRIPSNRTINRRIRQLDEYVIMRAKKGEAAAQRHVRASGKKLISSLALSLVQIDTHYLDILIIDPDTGEVLGRPYLVCIIDIKTRMVVGVHISLYPPSSISALAALKDMITRYGIPTVIVPDNGVELKNTTFSFVCETFCITIARAQVRDPNGKAHIESFFRSLTYGIIQKLSGTTFSNPHQRTDYDSSKNAVFTLEQVREFIIDWINNIYHQTIHTRTGRAPIKAWEDDIKIVPPMLISREEIDKIARKPCTRSVHNGRIRVNHLEYFSHALATKEKEVVTVLVDELDLDKVYVQLPLEKDTLILAESIDHEYTHGLTIYEHEEALKIRKEMTAKDIASIGINAALLSRYRLLEKIHSLKKLGKKLKRKLLNGASRNNSNEILPPRVDENKCGSDGMSMSFQFQVSDGLNHTESDKTTYTSTIVEY